MANNHPAVSYPSDDVVKVTWTDIATGDTIFPWIVPKKFGAMSSVQMAGTFGGATVTLTGSNDETNYVTVKDIIGSAISLTAADLKEFSSTCLLLKPAISGGTGDAVTVTMILRG